MQACQPDTFSYLFQWEASSPHSCCNLASESHSQASLVSSSTKSEQPQSSENYIPHPIHFIQLTDIALALALVSLAHYYSVLTSNLLTLNLSAFKSILYSARKMLNQFLPVSCLKSLMPLQSFWENSKFFNMDKTGLYEVAPSIPQKTLIPHWSTRIFQIHQMPSHL